MITFEKKKNSFGSHDRGEDFKAYVYKPAGTKAGAPPQIIIRVARHVLDRAGWFIGDYVIPSVDPEARQWSLTRTTDREKGYMVTSTQKNGKAAAYVKLTTTDKDAEASIPGGYCVCRVVNADSRRILAGF